MDTKGLDAFVLTVNERANSESCYYISGFRGSSAALIISMHDAVLITDGRYQTQAKSQTPYKIIIQSELSLPEYIAKAVSDSEYVRVGFEAEKISHAAFTKHFAPAKTQWLDASDFIPKLRRTKDAQEIAFIRKAAQIARQAYGNMLEHVHAGMTEVEFDSLLMTEIKKLGAEKGWAHDDFIVASGLYSLLKSISLSRKYLHKK